MEQQEDWTKVVATSRDLFRRIGIRSVSMDDIARELGVSKKTLYQVVDNKEQLVGMVLSEQTCNDLDVMERNREEAADAIDELLRNSRHFIRLIRSVSPTAMHDLQKYYPEIFHSRVKEHQKALLEGVKQNLRRGIAEGIYRSDIDADVIAHLYVGMTMMVMDRNVFPAYERPLSDILHQHSTYHFNGIVNEAGYERVKTYLQQEDLQ